MSTFKKAKVVMIPTEKSSLFTHADELLFNKTGEREVNLEYGTQPQHLYILSDEEIKEGDWFINELNQVWKHNGKVQPYKGSKKIIATTDTSLIKTNHRYTIRPIYASKFEDNSRVIATVDSWDKKELIMPKPSQSFIEKYISEYNKGNVITDVLVEYEYIAGGRTSAAPEVYEKGFGLQLKVSPKDNTITIRPVKNSWSRNEVVELLTAWNFEFHENSEIYKQGLNKWIEENL